MNVDEEIFDIYDATARKNKDETMNKIQTATKEVTRTGILIAILGSSWNSIYDATLNPVSAALDEELQ